MTQHRVGLAQHTGDSHSPRRAPRDCPVCGHELAVTRLGCVDCGTEISGLFSSCRYCALTESDLEMLRVFLVSRGNMKELERFLGVSYPTARQRFTELLGRLGMEDAAGVEPDSPGADSTTVEEPPAESREQILQRLAGGELDLDEAEALLADR